MEGMPGGFGDILHYEFINSDGEISYLCMNGEPSEKVALPQNEKWRAVTLFYAHGCGINLSEYAGLRQWIRDNRREYE